MLQLDPFQRRKVAYVFRDRYKYDEYNKELKSEITWLVRVKELLESEVTKRKGKMSAHTIGFLIDPYLKDAIEKLSV